MTAARKRLGAFEVLYALKSGGMGEVLLAQRRGPGGFEQLVAVKTIRSDLTASPSVRGMFLDEARLLARLAHPAIATVLDFGEEEGVLYLGMEYVRGIPFRELAARRPPPAIAARAVAEACRGLHAAHELTDLAGTPLGVVHRDISPENLMLGFDGQVKVLDFGIALVKGRQTVTEHGTVKGKPPYMSPEQVRGEPLDRRSDVFSVALVLHELLTGTPVFRGEHLYAVARAVIEQELRPPGVSADLDAAVMRALVRDREARTPSAMAFAEELERAAAAAGGESLEAWTARALAAERDANRKWLADAVVGPGATRRVGRASGVVTAAAGDAAPAPQPPPEADTSPEPPPRRGRAWLPALLLALFLGGGLVALLVRDCGSSPAVEPDAAGVIVTAPVPLPDAASVIAATPDAGVVVVAEVPPDAGVRRRPKVVEPKDAAPRPIPPPDAAPTAVAPGPGYITVTADPYVIIVVDGKDFGTSPVYNRRLPAGAHEVELRDAAGGGSVYTEQVDFASGWIERFDRSGTSTSRSRKRKT